MSESLKKIPIKVQNVDKDSATISLYETQKKLYPRSVKGLFNNFRILFVIGTQLLYLGLPWLQWNGRQAVFFDLINRKFYLFGLTVWPQDFVYLAALLMCCAFALFTWTTIAGRLWCGYSCPQTVYTEIMLWIEQWVEGDRNKRMKLDAAPMSLNKLRLKSTKHFLMLAFSLWTGFTLVGYFTPIRSLVAALPTFGYGPWETFWMFFYGGFTYLFAGFMREQVCKYMCPYARFQSVMFDADTLIISYDEARGEPRGARKKGADPKEQGLGDCINCSICVQVCPVGIDIRNGLQYECIGCAACIDACDDVMDKMGYPRGLIRYTTENALEGKYPEKAIASRLKRPRVVLYSLVLLIVFCAAVTSLALRKPFKVDIIRDRASLVRETEDGWLENSYIIKIINTTEQNQRFAITANGLPGIKVKAEQPETLVRATETESITVQVQADPQYATKGSHEIHFVIQSLNNPALRVEEKSSFIGE
ncbi:cytochrome c oxidase accessory protein CcoG [Chromobacterium amazonense]|uniref:Cytochrome c oxidase accessory protein CcoG n=2 Tax=Chromobacterium amazonense TaxID=1382803 RepID=A0A2S9X7I7_9NEIS|nr:cytochrome c oxidase accessory protein CcoG [Chromobacterium amazonense]MBM2883057.1 cytochrome c oxidase accessory protein CcoG [Chromobacterium amazonense]MDE1712874.1 cytochrome c oxidase accessory protein CcoG [Chromobacterium amazonense]PRP71688.1 cytochrome c oxidase accessory protein CcoG [Chromobacterium amazonense]